MKNLQLLPEDIRDKVHHERWHCRCGQDDLGYSVTRKGTVQARCFRCGQTIYFNDVQIFRFKDGPWIFDKEVPVKKPMKMGGVTYWYPRHRVRLFLPEGPG